MKTFAHGVIMCLCQQYRQEIMEIFRHESNGDLEHRALTNEEICLFVGRKTMKLLPREMCGCCCLKETNERVLQLGK
jgi:hypothetical protein